MIQLCDPCRSQFILEDFVSPIPKHLLETNDPPLHAEKQGLTETLAQATRDLSLLEQKIAELDTIMQTLKQHRDGMQYSIMVNQGLLSPVRLIPREIWAHIFTFALSSSPTKLSLDTSSGIWPLSRVCRIWKEAALTMPRCWTNIDITFDETFGWCSSINASQILRTIFANANGKAVRMSLNISSEGPRSKSLLETAIRHSAQWRDVSLSLRSKLLPLLKKLRKSLPVLEQLSLERNPPRRSATAASIGTAFSVAPALRSLTIKEFEGLSDLDLPWSQITHFDLSLSPKFTYYRQLFAILPKLSNLQSLRLRECDDYLSYNIDPIRLEKLERLELSSNLEPLLLDKFTLPALKEIHNICSRFDEIKALIHRSGCSIKTLGFEEPQHWHIDDTSLIFAVTPTVTKLWLGNGFNLYRVSTAVSSDPSICPQLEEVTLSATHLESNSVPTHSLLAELIERRNIKRVSIVGTPTSDRSKDNYVELVEKFSGQVQFSWEPSSDA